MCQRNFRNYVPFCLDDPLFEERLGLHSIDALDLILGLEKAYGVIIPDAEVGQKVFQSERTIAQYVVDNSGGG